MHFLRETCRTLTDFNFAQSEIQIANKIKTSTCDK